MQTVPQFHFIVTVQTHGPYAHDKTRDVIDGKEHPGISDYHDRLVGRGRQLRGLPGQAGEARQALCAVCLWRPPAGASPAPMEDGLEIGTGPAPA